MTEDDPDAGPPPSPTEQALIDHVSATLERLSPVHEGPYALTLTAGPVRWDRDRLYASVVLDALDRSGAPWTIDARLRICPRSASPARSTAIVEALTRVVRRVMRDAGDDRFERAWFGVVTFDAAMRKIEKSSAKTVEACEEVMLATRSIAEIIVAPREVVDAAVVALAAWFAAHPSITWSADVELAVAGEILVHRWGLNVTLRLIITANGEIRDIKEQEVFFAPMRALADVPRLIAFLEATVEVVPRLFERLGADIETRMPHELIETKVLALKKPRSATEFAAALVKRWKL